MFLMTVYPLSCIIRICLLEDLQQITIYSGIRIYSLTWILHVTNTILEIAVVFSMVGLLYYFYKTWRTDPGYVKTSEKERKEVGDFVKTNGRANLVRHIRTFGWCVCHQVQLH